MKQAPATVVLAFALQACTAPHAYPIPEDSARWNQDEAFKRAIEKLSEPEQELLAAYLLRTELEAPGAQGPLTTTIGEAIERQKEFEAQRQAEAEAEARKQAEQKALAKAIEQQRKKRVAAMNEALTVAVSKLEFIPSNYRVGRYRDGFAVSIALHNNTDKSMLGIKGMVVFADLFGDEIQRVGLAIDDPIAAGRSLRWDGRIDYNQFMDADVKLRNTELDKLNITWKPHTYLFADGSTMSLEPSSEEPEHE